MELPANSPAKLADLPYLFGELAAWQGCLAGSSKTAPRFLKFSIAMGADYWSELIFMPTWVLAFCAHNNFRLDRVSKNWIGLLISLIRQKAVEIWEGEFKAPTMGWDDFRFGIF